jgi:thiol peroxidase
MERKAVYEFKGLQTLIGPELKIGDKVPEFTVLNHSFETVSSKTISGKVRIISVVPQIDTGVCDAQTRRFNEEAANLGGNVKIWTVSVDLPPTQKRWCASAGIDNIEMLSDYRDLDFGQKFGVYVKKYRLLARSVFVIDKDDTIRFVEYLPQVGQHPDYDAALAAAKELL